MPCSKLIPNLWSHELRPSFLQTSYPCFSCTLMFRLRQWNSSYPTPDFGPKLYMYPVSNKNKIGKKCARTLHHCSVNPGFQWWCIFILPMCHDKCKSFTPPTRSNNFILMRPFLQIFCTISQLFAQLLERRHSTIKFRYCLSIRMT